MGSVAGTAHALRGPRRVGTLVARALGPPPHRALPAVDHHSLLARSDRHRGQSPRTHTEVRAVWAPLSPELLARLHTERSQLSTTIPFSPAAIVTEVSLRIRGTDHALPVPFDAGATSTSLEAAFADAHRNRYGFTRDGALEVVSLRLRALASTEAVASPPPDAWSLSDKTHAGPALLTSPTTSVWVPAGWTARVTDGLLRLERCGLVSDGPAETERTPRGAALWSSRFTAVAEQAGEVLRRLARSVNIRERRDFSCAVFDRDGHLIANAPHIPVHLGAMGQTVRDLITRVPELEPGQSWVCNDPRAGGSHLPDLTVITPVYLGDERFFTACRAHHVDVGGTTPGSMPPRATSLAEEGIVLHHVPLLEHGRLADLGDALHGCRLPDTVRADLEAQLAANRHAARALAALGPPALVATWAAHLLDVAEESLDAALPHLDGGRATDTIDGVPLALSLTVRDRRICIDLTGTGGPHPGNLNAPTAVLGAAVLYALRLLVDQPLPLNEGTLRRVDWVIPSPSIVSPPPGAAVAGGNVETSQRLVDLVLRATGRMAASQGTMNNLTLGGAGWSFYETLGGGQGASPGQPGVSGRQIHMTNTRATDPEVLERRLPLRLHDFAVRHGSGGRGRYPGGNGLLREIEVLEPATASLLATRRTEGAAGLNGGAPGAPGAQWLQRGGAWEPWSGATTHLRSGDRVRVLTPGGGGLEPE